MPFRVFERRKEKRQSAVVTRFDGKEEGNMSYLIDDVARILAGPTPRRKALKLIGGMLASGLFGSVAFGQSGGGCLSTAAPGSPCPSDTSKICCGQFCLGAGILNEDTCCSNSFRCPPTQCCDAVCCCPPGFNGVSAASGTCQSSGSGGLCKTGAGTRCIAGG